MQLVCEDGVIDVDLDRGVRVGQGTQWTDCPTPGSPTAWPRPSRREWRAFLDAIARGGPSPVPAAYGRHVVGIVEAALGFAARRAEVAVAG